MSVAKYHIDLFWSDEDDCWVANVPDLKYCSAFGDTPSEAAREIEIAMQLWLEAASEKDQPLPEARYVSEVSHPWLKAPSTSSSR